MVANSYSAEVELALKVQFSDEEKELIRFCAKHFAEKGETVAYQDLLQGKEVRQGILRLTDRPMQFGLMCGDSSCTMRVLPACLELVHAWDNPPPEPLPDYRDKLSKWFWSKRWSTVIYVLVVALPAALGYVVMAKTIFEWLGIIKGSK